MRPPTRAACCAALLGFTSTVCAQSWTPVPPANFATIQLSQFDDHELEVPIFLNHFAQVANSVVENTTTINGVTYPRGFLNIKVNREPKDNLPHNARILEMQAVLAYFYTADRPWNPYRGSVPVRQRLEAMLNLWTQMQAPEGHSSAGLFTEYSTTNWSLAPTTFGVMHAAQALDLIIDSGLPFDPVVLESARLALRRSLVAVFTRPDMRAHARSWSNQFSGSYHAALIYLENWPDAELDAAFVQAVNDSAAQDQSPAGFFYEQDGPDFGYSGVHDNNLRVAWPRLKNRADLVLGDQPPPHGLAELVEGAAAGKVTSAPQGQRRRLDRIGRHAMVLVDIGQRPAVGDHMAREFPLPAQDIAQQEVARAARLAPHAVVGAHDRLHPGLAHQFLERRQIRVPQVVRGHRRVEGVPLGFRPRVHREMFGASRRFEVPRIVALQTAHERRAEHTREHRVLAPRFLSASPARVAEDIDVRRPEGQALVVPAFPGEPQRLVVLGPRLVRDGRGHPPHELRVPRGRQPDDLRKHRGPAVPRHAVQRLVPVIVGWNPKPRHGPRRVHHLRDLLVQRQLPHQIGHALIERQERVAEARGRGHASIYRHATVSRKAARPLSRFSVGPDRPAP